MNYLLAITQDDLVLHGKTITTAILLGLCVTACYTDLSKGRVPNWLTMPCMIAGLIIHFLVGGWNEHQFSMSESLSGLITGGGTMVFFYFMGGLGGGDVKLFAAVGALKGQKFTFDALFTSFLIGLAMAIFNITFRWLTYNPNAPVASDTSKKARVQVIHEDDMTIEEKKEKARKKREAEKTKPDSPESSSEDPEKDSKEEKLHPEDPEADEDASTPSTPKDETVEKLEKIDQSLQSEDDKKMGIPFGFAISIGVIVTLLIRPGS